MFFWRTMVDYETKYSWWDHFSKLWYAFALHNTVIKISLEQFIVGLCGSNSKENPQTRPFFPLSKPCWIRWCSQIWWLIGVSRYWFYFCKLPLSVYAIWWTPNLDDPLFDDHSKFESNIFRWRSPDHNWTCVTDLPIDFHEKSVW